MRFHFFLLIILLGQYGANSQADNEIQVYASPTIQHKWTIFELHNNYTFKGSKYLVNAKDAKWYNTTLEITHGFGKNFEIGFYTFAGIAPGGGYQYLGNQVRPRLTVPESWKWKVGASLSLEFGFFRPDDTTQFYWQGEIRPIIDKTIGNWYFAFNPNIDFVVSGNDKGAGIAPQFKAVYTIKQKLGIGFEYYGGLGSFDDILPGNLQEHLIGPVIDIYTHPMWEVNTGLLFGLTKNSNQQVLKILLGRRWGKETQK
ncbi:MAG: hypothetical protein ACT4OJ_15815 [Bacteroidota bacterium]